MVLFADISVRLSAVAVTVFTILEPLSNGAFLFTVVLYNISAIALGSKVGNENTILSSNVLTTRVSVTSTPFILSDA